MACRKRGLPWYACSFRTALTQSQGACGFLAYVALAPPLDRPCSITRLALRKDEPAAGAAAEWSPLSFVPVQPRGGGAGSAPA